jgi:hypothetical protein
MNPSTTLDLRDIHAAAPPAFWPPAPGWWVLAVLLLAVLAATTIWLLRRYHARRQQRLILAELESVSARYSEDNTGEYAAQISMLLRRVALRRYSRARVASLTGGDWLRFLDATGGNGDFEHGVGRVLETGPYSPHHHDLPAAELQAAARRWVEQNLKVAA